MAFIMRKCDRASELAVLSAMYRKRFRNRRGIRNLPDRYCRKSTWCFHSKFSFKRKHASKQLGTRRSPCLTILLCEITVLVRNAPIVYSFRLSGSNAKSIDALTARVSPPFSIEGYVTVFSVFDSLLFNYNILSIRQRIFNVSNFKWHAITLELCSLGLRLKNLYILRQLPKFVKFVIVAFNIFYSYSSLCFLYSTYTTVYINNDKQIVSKLVCKFAATGQVCLEVNITDKRPLHYEICVLSGIGYDTYGPICLFKQPFILNICFFITFSACKFRKNRYSSPLNFREVYNSCKV